MGGSLLKLTPVRERESQTPIRGRPTIQPLGQKFLKRVTYIEEIKDSLTRKGMNQTGSFGLMVLQGGSFVSLLSVTSERMNGRFQ